MRIKNLYLLVVFFLFFSCNNSSRKSNINIKTKGLNQKDTLGFRDTQKNITNNYKDIFNVYLIGMEVLEEDNHKDNYKKYGVDYTGACYSTDLLKMKITNKEVLISNYYDANINKRFQIVKIVNLSDSLIIRTNLETHFKIYKIKGVPIYSLEYQGELNIDVRMSKFIAKESDIERFGGIDCGDFDG